MRALAIALLLMTSCDRNAGERQADVEAQPAAIGFDGAQVTEASARIAHGKRIADVLGCTGCHRDGLEGGRFYERYASNLTRDVPKYSDAQLEHVLRSGVPIDGRELWGMPSEIFQHLSGPDMAALIAYLRTIRSAGAPTQPPLAWTQEARDEMAKGNLKPAAVFVRERRNRTPADLGPKHALGRYITMVTCAECHGPQLNGVEGFSPDLIVAGTYTRAEFEQLMTRGIPSGGRKLKNELMQDVAKERFARLTPGERDMLHAYLKARAEQPQKPQ